MQLIMSGRGVILTPAFKAQVERKVARLRRVLPAILDARLVCEAEKFRRTARLTLRARRRTFATEATASDLLVAVDEAVETLRRQVCADKERRRQPKGRAPHRRPGTLGLPEPAA